MVDEATTETDPTKDTPWPWILGTAGLFGLVTFSSGFAAMDSPTPDTGRAMGFYLFTVFFGVAAIAVAAVLRPTRDHTPLLGGAGAGVLTGALFATMAEDSYYWGIGWILAFWVLPTLVVAYGVTLLVLGLTRGHEGLREACTAWGVLAATTTAVAALIHLVTLDHQAEAAQAAHEAPGLGMVLAAVVLVGLAVRARQS